MEEFMRYGSIRRQIEENARRGQTEDFDDIVRRLCYESEGNLVQRARKLPYPDFGAWDIEQLDGLCELMDELPISLGKNYDIHAKKTFGTDGILRLTGLGREPIRIFPCSSVGDNHMHTQDSFEINLLLRGKATIRLAHAELLLDSSALCILSPHTAHAIVCADPTAIVVTMNLYEKTISDIFSVIFSNNNSILAHFFKNSLKSEGRGYLLLCVGTKKRVRTLVRSLFAEFFSYSPFRIEMCTSYIELLLLMAIRESSEVGRYVRLGEHREGSDSSFLAILQYIRENFRTLSLLALSEHFHYTPNYLGSLIKTNTGKSYTELVSGLKLAAATELLLTTTLPMEEIARQAGYGDAVNFSRKFRKQNGISPSGFRRTHTGV